MPPPTLTNDNFKVDRLTDLANTMNTIIPLAAASAFAVFATKAHFEKTPTDEPRYGTKWHQLVHTKKLQSWHGTVESGVVMTDKGLATIYGFKCHRCGCFGAHHRAELITDYDPETMRTTAWIDENNWQGPNLK